MVHTDDFQNAFNGVFRERLRLLAVGVIGGQMDLQYIK